MQELKGKNFPPDVFQKLGYESVAVTQKAYNGVAVLSRHPMETITQLLPATRQTAMPAIWR